MNSNQRSQGNNQSDNGGNEKSVSSSRGGTVEKDNLNQSQQSGTRGAGSQQSGTLGGSSQQQGGQQQQQPQTGSMQSGSQRDAQGQSQQGSRIGQQSTDRTGSQTGSQQQGIAQQHQSNDLAGGLPRSPGTSHLAADQDMDDDTGLSNKGNRQSADDIDNGSKQEKQSNVGRRSDMTPD